MFESLKEKLKNWIKKNEEPEIVETKKEKKKKERPAKKEKIPKKKKQKEEVKKTPIEEKEITEQEEPKKSSWLDKLSFRKKEEKEIQKEREETKERIEEKEEQTSSEEEKSLFSVFQKTIDEERFEELFKELEITLLQNNVSLETVESIKNSLKERLIGKSLKEVNLSEELKDSINNILINPPDFIKNIKDSLKEKSPYVILFAGINGAGKTTTIAKIANYLKKNKLSVCLAASDTFRAASIEQLKEHADKLNIPLIKKDYGSDPASVGFEAISYAKKNKIDVVLIDTAGRLQNKDSLMKEIEKISRVNNPDLKLFIGESITGNDCTEQAKGFDEMIKISGIVLSKADVDEKGGTAISVSNVTGKPIYFLGTGQKYDDLEIFDKDKLIEKLGL